MRTLYEGKKSEIAFILHINYSIFIYINQGCSKHIAWKVCREIIVDQLNVFRQLIRFPENIVINTLEYILVATAGYFPCSIDESAGQSINCTEVRDTIRLKNGSNHSISKLSLTAQCKCLSRI